MSADLPTDGLPRRHFVGYVVAAPTLVATAELGVLSQPARGTAATGGSPPPRSPRFSTSTT